MDSHGIGLRQSQVTVRKTPFWCHLILKTIILPRQARDKHRKSCGEEKAVFLKGPPNHMAEGGGDNERPRVVLDDQGDLEWLFVGQLLAVKGVEGGQDAARLAAFRAL